MLKYAALLFNTIALLICQFFFVEDVKISQNLPASAKPDTEFIVELTITKGAMGGFAKLQQFVPQGLSVVPIEMKGGDFKFVDQQMKIIWMSLPSDPEFKISYKVKVAAGVGGDKKFSGKFSYVVDNVKQETLIPESIVSIKSGADQSPVVAATPAETSPVAPTPVETKTEVVPTQTTPVVKTEPTASENNVAKTEPVVTETKTETKTENVGASAPTPTKSTTTQDASGVMCTRKVPERFVYSKTNATNDFVVEIKINKGNISGFAKLLETLPAGFVATGMESAGATFTFVDQKVKFVWVSIPAQTEFLVSYKVSVPDGVSGNINVDGVFSYIEDNETKKATIATSTVIIDNAGAGTIAVVDPKENVGTTATTTTTSTNNNVETGNLTSTPAAQVNISYRVQIAALHNAVAASNLAARYNISQSVITEMADGFTKYTVGAHSEYKSARDAREEIRNKGVVGPFVTAYDNTGRRITVQDALMATSQKWYK